MQMVDMFYDQLEDAKNRRVPFVLPIGTIEYHAHHASCGTDTLVVTGCLRELEKKKEIVVCPPIWYGVASYAVCGPRVGHVHVDEDAYTAYLCCVLKSMVEGGVKNIYCVPHHQTEGAGLMPMTIACHKAAKKVIMEYLEQQLGRGWWGSDRYADYYANLGSGDDPFSYIKVIPLIGADAQRKCGGFDHAGKFESSLMMACDPERVDLSRCRDNTEWFAASAAESSVELGTQMQACTLEWLMEAIQ